MPGAVSEPGAVLVGGGQNAKYVKGKWTIRRDSLLARQLDTAYKMWLAVTIREGRLFQTCLSLLSRICISKLSQNGWGSR
jgi:hypothetical protein